MKIPFQNILDSISRRKGSWYLGLMEGKVTLAVGAPNAVKVQGGTISVVGLSHDEIVKLRDTANDLLGVAPTDPAPPPSRGS